MLPALGEGELLRPGAADPGRLRLPLGAGVSEGYAALLTDPTELAWKEFHRRLRAFVARRVTDLADADDIVQEVFLRMSLTTLRSADGVGAWLHRTARNLIADHYRAAVHRHEEAAGDTRAVDARRVSPSAGADDHSAGAACVAKCLRPLVERLPDAYRRAIEKVELGGMTQLRAAATEGLSLSGMKARVQRARQRLRDIGRDTMASLYDASAAALAVFLVLAAIDGLCLHIWRYRLHVRDASRYEHRLHTATAVVFAATLPALFLWETGGLALWAGVALVAADLGVSILDMVSERDSRADLGGLSTGEYVLHMFIMGSRAAAIALALGGRPGAAWAFDAPLVIGPLPRLAATIAELALPGAIVIGALHVWLCAPAGVRAFEALRSRAERAIVPLRACPGKICCIGRAPGI